MSEIENFTKRTKTATNAKSKEVRLTLTEAQAMSMELVTLLEIKGKLLEQITALQERIISLQEARTQSFNTSDGDLEVNVDGGSF